VSRTKSTSQPTNLTTHLVFAAVFLVRTQVTLAMSSSGNAKVPSTAGGSGSSMVKNNNSSNSSSSNNNNNNMDEENRQAPGVDQQLTVAQQHPQGRSSQPALHLTSDEVNYLIFRYVIFLSLRMNGNETNALRCRRISNESISLVMRDGLVRVLF
jgi:hypothetical protein